MALIKCPECNHDVSDTAITCPNCGYALRKDVVQQKRASFFSRFKIPIIIAIIIWALAGWYYYDQSTIPKNRISEFMSDLKYDHDKWELAFGETSPSYGVSIWDTCELIDGLSGELTVVRYDNGDISNWRWELIGDDSTMKTIKRSFTKPFKSVESKSIEDHDECYEYKWVEYADNNYSKKWVRGDEELTSEMVKGEHHSVILLRKGNKIAVQYIPTNRYEGWNTSYYKLD